MRRGTSTGWPGAVFEIGCWLSLLSMRLRSWTCRGGFLPLVTAAQGQTLYAKVAQPKCLPGDAKEIQRSPDL